MQLGGNLNISVTKQFRIITRIITDNILSGHIKY